MKHNDNGRAAEEAVETFLKQKGYKIIDRNWKTKQCEIDIIAQKDGCIHFVEVKYRSSSSQGSGFDYITRSKQRQMGFAADIWVAKNNWADEFVLSAAEVLGVDFNIKFLEVIH
jgi:ribonuclease HII